MSRPRAVATKLELRWRWLSWVTDDEQHETRAKVGRVLRAGGLGVAWEVEPRGVGGEVLCVTHEGRPKMWREVAMAVTEVIGPYAYGSIRSKVRR